VTQMPRTRAQLAFDIVGSSAQDDDLLASVRTTSEVLLRQAFDAERLDFDDRTNVSPTGDGDLMSFPETSLPRIVDMAHHLHGLLLHHNRTAKPEVPMRLSVHTGPLRVTSEASFQRGYIELSRMLESTLFKQVVRKCQQAGPYGIALILSDQAYRTAVRARHTTLLVPHDFADVVISGKNFEDRCWIHVPGVDANRVREYADSAPEPGGAASAEESDDAGGDNLARANVIGTAIGGDNHDTVITNFGTWRGRHR
jgi:hypothetical protein